MYMKKTVTETVDVSQLERLQTFTKKMPDCFIFSDLNEPRKKKKRKKKSYFPLYWLFNSDPYNGILKSPQNWVV